MKHRIKHHHILIASFFIFNLIAIASSCQTRQQIDGNEITDKAKPKAKPVLTTYTYNHNGQKLPVYKTANGKYFTPITSKKGTVYKKYLLFSVSFADDVRNPENYDYVCETGFNNGDLPTRKVTQSMFNTRYGITPILK